MSSKILRSIFLTALLLATAANADSLSASQIMERSDISAKVADATSEMTMTLTNSAGDQRVRKLVMMTKLKPNEIDNMRVLRFLSPADIRGTVTLLVEKSGQDDDMWIYLPALKKVRRLVSDNKRDSFVGSDMTFGDIIGHKPSEWNHTLIRPDTLDGKPVYVIESAPKDAQVKSRTGYSKRQSWIDQQNFVSLKTDYWDDVGKPLKSIHVSDVREADASRKKWQFMHVEATNQQSGHKTVLHFDSYRANQGITEDTFTPRYLEKDQ